MEGTTNILIQAQKAGIKNFAIVSSIGAAIDFACLGAKLDENSERLDYYTRIFKCLRLFRKVGIIRHANWLLVHS